MILKFDRCRRDTGFRFVTGCRAACERKLREGFAPAKNGFVANVSAEHMDSLLRDYIAAQTEELFFFLEVPTSLHDETEQGKLHTDVYYWDGISKAGANTVLDEFGDWLIGDGMLQFGFGVKGFSSEIMKQKYNVISVYSCRPEQERVLLQKHLPFCSRLRTAWDYIDPRHPGECFLFERDGRTIYDVLEAMKARGLYFAERREI
jgi:hypothetical protein